MNWDRIEGNWKQFAGKVKQEWGELTDDDLKRIEGRKDELLGRIQERYGIARHEAERRVSAFVERLEEPKAERPETTREHASATH